ncbi:hypothetical protein K227x_19870 [Rubripirellula lacrimiformis]|uniref:Uncharacterized protein n=1 Tax=Rubripirellula lacrimiformis TaxID=1930273 RepID=A0A517N8Y6_9BACT|nr:hypothetical protein K227x_19870 [Rubripirellula lacrimiformis]
MDVPVFALTARIPPSSDLDNRMSIDGNEDDGSR